MRRLSISSSTASSSAAECYNNQNKNIMPEAVSITLFSYVPLRTPAGLAGFLDLLDSTPGFTPERWGLDERARNPYNQAERQELIEEVCAEKGMFLTPGLRRRKALRYEAYFDAYAGDLGQTWFEFDPGPAEADLPRLFEFADALAAYFRPAFGHIHRFWRVGERSQKYNGSAVVTIDDLQRYGLDSVCARTWYGPHLLGLIGLPLLEASGALVQQTPWGGVQIDLAEQPWEVDPEVLLLAQERVMQTLVTSGAYGDFTDLLHKKTGANWVPLPDTHPILPVARCPQPARPETNRT